MKTCKMTPNDLLLIVDPQNDFMPEGALAVKGAERIIPVLNDWIDAAEKSHTPIIVTRDWHPSNHCSFKEHGGAWPVHCVQGTPGAAFDDRIKLPPNTPIINKAYQENVENYSALSGQLHESQSMFLDWLKLQSIHHIWVQGLCLDYCVLATALDCHSKGYVTHVVLPATHAVNPQSGYKAVLDMRNEGIILDNDPNPWLHI